jgi:hypothetical protein
VPLKAVRQKIEVVRLLSQRNVAGHELMQIMSASEDLPKTEAPSSERSRMANLITNTRRNFAMRLVCWAFLLAGQFWTPTALSHFVAFVEASIEDERRRL